MPIAATLQAANNNYDPMSRMLSRYNPEWYQYSTMCNIQLNKTTKNILQTQIQKQSKTTQLCFCFFFFLSFQPAVIIKIKETRFLYIICICIILFLFFWTTVLFLFCLNVILFPRIDIILIISINSLVASNIHNHDYRIF